MDIWREAGAEGCHYKIHIHQTSSLPEGSRSPHQASCMPSRKQTEFVCTQLQDRKQHVKRFPEREAGTSRHVRRCETQASRISQRVVKCPIWGNPHFWRASQEEGLCRECSLQTHQKYRGFSSVTSSAGSALTNLHLDEGCLVRQGSRDHPRVTEARPQERSHGK